MKKFAIYTAIVGNYDTIRQPLAADERFDYYLFSNDIPEERIGIWQVRPIPYSNPIRTKIARWVKTHPEELLPKYEYSLWIDANIQICLPNVYERSIALKEDGAKVASMWHHQRDCIYDEAVAVLCAQREHEKPVFRWIQTLKRDHYPHHNGLFETGVLFRNHQDKTVQKMDSLWWDCISHYSRRDQLSFGFALWKNNLDCTLFLPKGQNTRNSPSFNYILHENEKGGVIVNRKEDPFINYYHKVHPGDRHEHLAKIYQRLFRTPFPLFSLTLLGQYYRAISVFHR